MYYYIAVGAEVYLFDVRCVMKFFVSVLSLSIFFSFGLFASESSDATNKEYERLMKIAREAKANSSNSLCYLGMIYVSKLVIEMEANISKLQDNLANGTPEMQKMDMGTYLHDYEMWWRGFRFSSGTAKQLKYMKEETLALIDEGKIYLDKEGKLKLREEFVAAFSKEHNDLFERNRKIFLENIRKLIDFPYYQNIKRKVFSLARRPEEISNLLWWNLKEKHGFSEIETLKFRYLLQTASTFRESGKKTYRRDRAKEELIKGLLFNHDRRKCLSSDQRESKIKQLKKCIQERNPNMYYSEEDVKRTRRRGGILFTYLQKELAEYFKIPEKLAEEERKLKELKDAYNKLCPHKIKMCE